MAATNRATAHRREWLRWVAACERLGNAIRPGANRPLPTREDVIDAFDIVRNAVDMLEKACLADSLLCDAEHRRLALPILDTPRSSR
jgi:hypothetical protein